MKAAEVKAAEEKTRKAVEAVEANAEVADGAGGSPNEEGEFGAGIPRGTGDGWPIIGCRRSPSSTAKVIHIIRLVWNG